MKRNEKTMLRIEYATKAVIEALEAFKERNGSDCITKAELIPHVARRAGWIMECDDNPVLDEYAIGSPNERFIWRKWSDICLNAAHQFKKYIVWEPRIGVRLGTFSEYQEIPNKRLADICLGMMNNMEDRAKVIIKQGGNTLVLDIQVKLLESGETGD